MAAVRIIACLDILDGKVVKGIKFGEHRLIGDPIELARKYSEEGIDELVFYDIGASPAKKSFYPHMIEKIARTINIPFTVAGGISSVDQAKSAIAAGADKISINSAAIQRPELISEIAQVLGSQAVVVGIDCRGKNIFRLTGSKETTEKTTLDVFDWSARVQSLGAGEIVMNCMDSDGTNAGGNISLMKSLRQHLSIPLVASGGLGTPEQFKKMLQQTEVSGALGASIFHFNQFSISEIKDCLRFSGLEVRK